MRRPNARYEHFGGIVALTKPPALLYVDQQYMRELGYPDHPLWDQTPNCLSAPTEVHFNVTNRCPLSCRHCTASSGDPFPVEMSFDEIKQAIDLLAEMKVFHIAFGGGELFSRPDAIEIAQYAASKGVVPNATTNGYYMTPQLAQACRVFGQINISLDGVGEKYGIIRGANHFEEADRALRMLVRAGVSTGINCMATSQNFEDLEDVVAYARKLKLQEVLFLRLKPAGRAKDIYDDFKLTPQQARRFFPLLLELSKKYKINIQTDCSFVPHICYHKPSKEMMSMFAIEGCEGGNVLLGLRQDGKVNACSHYEEYIEGISGLPSLWHGHEHFTKFRERKVTDPRCTGCDYFSICRGGCPLFSEFITGEFNAPDPECPVLNPEP